MTQLNGKIALVTGGNSGIGYASAKELKSRGAQVIITGRRKDALDKAAAELDVIPLVADQSSIKDIEALASEAGKRFGKIDILIVNAGITQFTTIEDAQEIMFDTIMNVNLKGAYFTLSRFVPLLNDGASVILVSSSSATVFAPSNSIYSASKAALNAVMKIAATELAPRSIRVNAVSPGPVATEIMTKIGVDEKLEKLMLSNVPLARMGKAEEVGSVIRFLASSESSFVTGAEFLVDGGHSINR